MRVEAYSPELAADRMAVRMTTFMIVPAEGIPIALKTVTNGLSSTPASCQGMRALIAVIEPMKKTTRRHRVAWMGRGTVAPGSFVSPAVIPMSSVPEKAKLTVSMVVKTAPRPVGKRPSAVRLCSSGAES